MRVLCLAVLAALAVAPAAAANFQFVEYRQPEVRNTQLRVFLPFPSVANSARVVVERGGAVVADASTNYNFLRVPYVPQAGEVVKLYSPKEATAPVAQYTSDAGPVIGPVCVGAKGFTGTRTANATLNSAYTYFPSNTTSTGGTVNNGNPMGGAPDTFAVTLSRPVLLEEYAVVTQRRTVGNAVIATVASRAVETCPPPLPQPTLDDGKVLFDKARDVKVAKNGKSVSFAVGCAKLSVVPCAGSAVLMTDARKPKKIGSKKFSIAAGTTKKVVVALSKAAQRELRRKKRLKTRLELRTANQGGLPLTKKSKLTLKKPR